MKILKKFIVLSLGLLMVVSCKPTPTSNTDPTCCGSTSMPSEVIEYTVTFNTNGGTMATGKITQAEGSMVNKPVDPTKKDNNFVAWYYESSLTTEVSWPLTLYKDYTLYAKWMENRTFFLMSRDQTVGGEFEYNFNLSVTTKIGALDGPGANISGNTKYNPNETTTFLSTETRSGALIGDGKMYLVKSGATKLLTIKQNTEGKISSYKEEEVGANFKYETSSFAKALFEYDEEDITAVSDNGNGQFQLQYSGSPTAMIQGAMTFLNHPLVDKIISLYVDLPDKDAGLKTYVTYLNGNIKTYNYEFSVSVSVGVLTFTYGLDFIKVGSGVSISPPSFPGYKLSETEVNTELNKVKTILDTYRNGTTSGYNYSINTAMKYPQSSFEINSTLAGRTMRKVEGGVNYFWNRIKFDSDYKNADLYKEQGIEDYERYRVKYANGSVYDVIDGILTNTYTEIAEYNNEELDGFYALVPNDFYAYTNINAVEITTDGNIETYSFSLSAIAVDYLLTFIDDTVRTDINNTHEFKIFNGPTDITPNEIKFDLEIENGAFKALVIDIDGALENSYPGTIFEGAADFEINLEISANYLAESYVVPTKNSEVDLSNS